MLFRFFGLSDGLVGLLSVWGDVSRALDGSGCRVVWFGFWFGADIYKHSSEFRDSV